MQKWKIWTVILHTNPNDARHYFINIQLEGPEMTGQIKNEESQKLMLLGGKYSSTSESTSGLILLVIHVLLGDNSKNKTWPFSISRCIKKKLGGPCCNNVDHDLLTKPYPSHSLDQGPQHLCLHGRLSHTDKKKSPPPSLKAMPFNNKQQ